MHDATSCIIHHYASCIIIHHHVSRCKTPEHDAYQLQQVFSSEPFGGKSHTPDLISILRRFGGPKTAKSPISIEIITFESSRRDQDDEKLPKIGPKLTSHASPGSAAQAVRPLHYISLSFPVFPVVTVLRQCMINLLYHRQ